MNNNKPRHFGECQVSLSILIPSIIFVYTSCLVLAAPSSQNDGATTEAYSHSRQNAAAVLLTKEERAWLAEHPNITLGAPTTYPPFVIKKNDGTHVGMAVDYLEAASRLLNHRISLQIEEIWSDVQEKAENREIDGLVFGAESPGRAALYNQTDTVFDTYFSVFGRSKDEYQIKQFADLNGMRIGHRAGASPTRHLLEKLSSSTLKTYDTHEQMTQALLSKEIDVISGWITYDFWRKEKMQGTIDNILLIEEYPMVMVTHIRNDWPELVSIMNKVIAAMRQDELPRILNKWFIDWPNTPFVHLTLEEIAWIKEHPVIRTQNNHYPPYMFRNNGQTVGLTVDLLHKISELTGITFEIEQAPGIWSNLLDRLIRHEDLDLLPAIMPTSEREKDILFTEPYIHSPRFIFTRDDTPFIASISQLYDKSVSVVEDFAVQRELKEKHPAIELLLFDNLDDAIKAVSEGQAFAFIGDMISTPSMINRLGVHNLKATCPSDLSDHRLAIGVRNDWSHLREILDKGLAAVPPDEMTAIINKWSTVRVDYGISFDNIIRWALVLSISFTLIILFFVFWNRQLHRKVRQRTAEFFNSESRFRATFEQASVGIAHLSAEGRIIRVNQHFCDIVGYTSKQIQDLSLKHITHPEDLNPDVQLFDKVLSGELDTYSEEKRYIRKDKQTVWIYQTVSLVRDGDDSCWYIAVIKDITERKNSDIKVRQLQDQYSHIARINAMGELSAALAHELKQPLAAIRSNTQAAIRFMSSPVPDMDELHEILQDVINDNRRADSIIQKVRSMVQKGNPVAIKLDVIELIHSILPLVKSFGLKNNIDIQLDIDKTTPAAIGDEIQLQQVIINLILNSTEALNSSSGITPKITLSASEKDERFIKIMVSDNGPGIDPLIFEHLFDPFYTTKKEGMGMGLAISRTIVEEHGGRLWVDNNPDCGASFSFTIPSAKENSL